MQKFVSTNKVNQLILIFLVLFLSAPTTSAEDMTAEPTQSLPSIPFPQGPTDPQELEAFIDGGSVSKSFTWTAVMQLATEINVMEIL